MTKQAIFFLLFTLSFGLFAQEKKVVTGKALLRNYCKRHTYYSSGVRVCVEGNETNYVRTDSDGKYRIEAFEDDLLIFNYLGCQEHIEIVGNRSVIDVTLDDDCFQDLGLPTVYNVQSDVSGSAKSTFMKDSHGYSFDILCTLPYIASERCRMGLYDLIKSRLAVGVNVTEINPEKKNIVGSLYFQFDFKKWLSMDIERGDNNFSMLPYVIGGLYIDAEDKEIQSQNFKYGTGLNVSFTHRQTTGLNLDIGYQGYAKQSSYNNFSFGAYPKVKWIPYWIQPNVGYQVFVKQPDYNNFFIGIRLLAVKRRIVYY